MRPFILPLLVLFSSSSAHATEETALKNKQLVQRLYEDCLNPGRIELLDQFVHADYVGAGGQKGPSGFASTVAGLRRGFPDIHYTVEDLVAEGDRVTARWTWKGTHKGEFAGFPASQRQVTNDGMAIFQIKDSRIVRTRLQTDRLGFLQAIGVLPDNLIPRTPPRNRQ